MTAYHRDAQRAYMQCGTCDLVFVPPHQHLSGHDEKAQYDLHKNDPNDQGYRDFLNRLAAPLSTRLTPRSTGLDFGCGPGPTLSVMLEEQGHRVALYDKFYAQDASVFDRHYDFITATEVIEHLANPRFEITRLWSCLHEKGWLGIMIKLVKDQDAFTHWHYILDPTHICFYSRETFAWLARLLDADLHIAGPDVILLQKR